MHELEVWGIEEGNALEYSKDEIAIRLDTCFNIKYLSYREVFAFVYRRSIPYFASARAVLASAHEAAFCVRPRQLIRSSYCLMSARLSLLLAVVGASETDEVIYKSLTPRYAPT